MGVDAPPAILVLVPQYLVDRALHLAAVSSAQHRVYEDVVRLQHRVSLKLTTPIAIGMLQAEQPIGRPRNAIRNFTKADIHAAIAGLRGLSGRRLRIPWKCAHLFQTLWIAGLCNKIRPADL